MVKQQKSILVVLSGGQDSTTCLFHAINMRGVSKVGAISFDYNQRHVRELDSAAFVYRLALSSRTDLACPYMLPCRRVIKLGNIFPGNSPLTTNAPLETYKDISEMDAKLQNRVELTFVPGRNALFFALAYSCAIDWGYNAIMTGVNGADNANYPDCTPEFIESLQETMELATRVKVEILTPLQGLSKKDIVEMAKNIPGCWDALAFTTTDYAGSYPPLNNHASVLRAHGFKEAGLIDPLIVRARMEGLL